MKGDRHDCRRSGRTTVSVLLVVAVVGLVAGLLWVGRGETDTPTETSSTGEGAGAAVFDEERAAAELERLQARISTVIEAKADPGDLLADARRYVERYPKLAAGRTALAQLLMFAGRWDEALEQFERSLELDPKQPEVRLFAGTLSRQAGRLEDAQRHYSQAVGLEPSNGRYRLHLARVYVDQQRYDEARQTLLEALRLEAGLHEAYAALAELYARQGKFEMAMGQIDRALERAPTDASRHREMYLRQKATLLRRMNEPAEALAVLRALPSQTLLEPGVSRELAACWAMLGEPQRAAWHYEQSLIVDPTRADAAAEAARWYLEAGMPDEARRNLDQLRKLEPRHGALSELQERLSRAESE